MSYLPFLLTLVALHAGPTQDPKAQLPGAPMIPIDCAKAERDRLAQLARLLTKSRFKEAQAGLQAENPGGTTKVFVDWAPVPRDFRNGYREAAQAAANEWNESLSGLAKFELTRKEEQADVVVLFERVIMGDPGGGGAHCLEVETDELNQSHRKARIFLGLNAPFENTPHPPESIRHLMARSLGLYLGLGMPVPPEADTDNPQPQPQITDAEADAKLAPTESEIKAAVTLQQARLQLMDFAKKSVTIYMPKSAIGIEPMSQDAGEVLKGDLANYKFTVHNTGDAPLEIIARPGCGCTVAKFDKLIPPGGTGMIEAQLRTSGYRGKVSKVINVTTNDPDKPQLVLALNADITPIIRFDTPTPNVIALNDKTDTVQDLGIHVSEKEKAEISRIVCSPSYVSGKLEKTSDHGDYKVTLTVGANAPVGRSNITVVAFSTSAREPQSSTQMICEKGIVVTPPSMYLGSITAQTQMPLTQQVVVRRREGAFKITGIDNDDPKLEIKQEMLPDSLGYRLAITYAGGWPKGFISRTLTIHTDDPLQPTFRVTVVAQVLVGK